MPSRELRFLRRRNWLYFGEGLRFTPALCLGSVSWSQADTSGNEHGFQDRWRDGVNATMRYIIWTVLCTFFLYLACLRPCMSLLLALSETHGSSRSMSMPETFQPAIPLLTSFMGNNKHTSFPVSLCLPLIYLPFRRCKLCRTWGPYSSSSPSSSQNVLFGGKGRLACGQPLPGEIWHSCVTLRATRRLESRYS